MDQTSPLLNSTCDLPKSRKSQKVQTEAGMNPTPLKTCNTCGRKYMSPEDFLHNTSRWRICESGHLWFNCLCNSTNMIIKGKYDWYDPTKQLSDSAQSIFNLIPNMKELPRIPSYVMEILTLIQDENTSSTKLASVAK